MADNGMQAHISEFGIWNLQEGAPNTPWLACGDVERKGSPSCGKGL